MLQHPKNDGQKNGKTMEKWRENGHSSLKPRGFMMIYGDLSSRTGYPAKWISTTFQK
jgi:hypothetical protein